MASATLKKLRYRDGMRVAVLSAPSGFEAELAGADVTRIEGARTKELELIQAFFTRKAHLAKELPRLKARLAPKGLLWICYPKGGALGTDLDRDVIRRLAPEAGLEAVAIVAIDPVWSALRLVAAKSR